MLMRKPLCMIQFPRSIPRSQHACLRRWWPLERKVSYGKNFTLRRGRRTKGAAKACLAAWLASERASAYRFAKVPGDDLGADATKFKAGPTTPKKRCSPFTVRHHWSFAGVEAGRQAFVALVHRRERDGQAGVSNY